MLSREGAGGARDDDPALRDLMVGYQQGRLDAFDGLYARLSGPLHAYLRSLSREGPRAQDLLQETFLQVHRARHTYQADRPVRPWIFAIARHVYLMDQRSRSRRREATTESGELPELPVPPAVQGLADRQRLRRALAGVTPPRREALLLHHLFGLSFREIAGLLGIREGAAKLRSSRGLGDLRRILGVTVASEGDHE